MLIDATTLIDKRFKTAIDDYVEHRVPTGGFLKAVLSNDLLLTYQHGDDGALANLPYIVAYIYSEIPSKCWGSPEKVNAWLESSTY